MMVIISREERKMVGRMEDEGEEEEKEEKEEEEECRGEKRSSGSFSAAVVGTGATQLGAVVHT